ncbi:hypothetical protein B484DRAFT_409221 [Ochromonadaceae sp. CCMP2298]|nr:hypothetical protein B484DRAFT_409221 [Ochromonadaceae sp. CCMP2298]
MFYVTRRFPVFGAIVYYHLTEAERDMSSDPRFKEKAMRGILLGLAPNVEGGYVIYPGGLKRPIVRKQVLVLEAKAAHVLPVYSNRYRLGDELSPTERTIPQRDATEADAPQPVLTRAGSRAAAADIGDAEVAHRRASLADTSTPYWSPQLTRKEAGVGARAEAVALTCALAGIDTEVKLLVLGVENRDIFL